MALVIRWHCAGLNPQKPGSLMSHRINPHQIDGFTMHGEDGPVELDNTIMSKHIIEGGRRLCNGQGGRLLTRIH